jgi:hypothetical protein
MLRTLDLEASSEDDAGKKAHDAGKTSQTHDVFDDVDRREGEKKNSLSANIHNQIFCN